MGSTIKRIFIEVKGRKQQRPCKLSAKDNASDVWTRAGALCVELKVSPEIYVQALFEVSENPMGPFPSAIAGNFAREAVGKYQRMYNHTSAASVPELMLSGDARVDWELQDLRDTLIAKTGSVDHRTAGAQEILREYHTGLSAWVRCFIAPADDIVMRRFGAEANAWLRLHPNECAVLRGRNPAAIDAIISYNG